MMNLFSPCKKFIHLDSVRTGSLNFMLHYKLTVALFIGASLLTSTSQFFGEPIMCTDVGGVNNDMLNSFCWIHQTYSLNKYWEGTAGKHYSQPGIGPDDSDRTYHSYYQWAITFYVPRLIWKAKDDGRIASIVQSNLKNLLAEREDREVEFEQLASYWMLQRGRHADFAFVYYLSECLNLANAVGQIFFIDYFLGFKFSKYGFDVINFSLERPENRVDPMNKFFPKVSKCDFHRYGPSGTIEYYDVLCILPINVINEKIYIILWFWLIFLAAVSTAYIAFLLFVAMCPFIRVDILKSRLFAPVTRRLIVSAISSEKMSWLQELGDWLVLDMVFWNLDSTTNSEILKYITGDWSRESHRRTDSEFANQTRNASSSRAIYYARQKKESRHPRASRRKNQAESENEKLNSYKNPEHSFLEETQSNRHCRVSTV